MSKVTHNSGDGVRIFFLFFIETICCTKEKKLKKFKKKIDFIHLHFFIKKKKYITYKEFLLKCPGF